jgi:hypothetical protein
MGKRTRAATGKTHKPRKHDLWKTIDPRAIPPLLPHLPAGRYAEPCAADGSLIRLIGERRECVWASDIDPQADWIFENDARTTGLGEADFFVTNPPWSRDLLHEIIVNLSNQAPTFLLFDADWKNTNQAGAFMERCRKIIHVGRLLWIPGTKNAGFTACCWHEFGRPIAGSAPTFFGHGRLPPEAQRKTRRICADCGVLIDRFGKWRLELRNGVPSPVHTSCAHPSGPPGAPAPLPLFDWMETD